MPDKKKRKIIGWGHRKTCKRGKYGWYYPILCDRKSFISMMKGLEKGSTKYWRKITLIIEELEDAR